MIPSANIDRNGFKLSCSIEGKGIPALVIGSHLYYSRLFNDSLKQHVKFYFTDHRGFTSPPNENTSTADYEMNILLDDVEAFRQHFDLQKFMVVGHSGHAFLALEYAKRYPQYVSGVVMIGVTPDYSAATHASAEAFFAAEASISRKELLAKRMQALPEQIMKEPTKRFQLYCLAAGPKTWYQEDFDAGWLWEGVTTNMTMIDYAWGVLFRDIDIRTGLSELDIPVYLGLGKYDFLTGPVHLWNPYINCFKDLTRVIFPNSAHNPPLEEAESFEQSLLNWVNIKVAVRN